MIRSPAIWAVGIVVTLQACGGGSSDPGPAANQAPQAANDILEVSATGATGVNVLSNDRDPEGSALSVSVAEAPAVGTASVNTDGTLRLDLPPGFRGVTRLRYRVTDSHNASAVATAVVFVDLPAYRFVFAAKTAAQNVELFLTDLITPVQISQSAPGNLPILAYRPSPRGSLVVYVRGESQVASPTTAAMEVVRTNAPSQSFSIPAPAGRLILANSLGISPDDRWIAFSTVASVPGAQTSTLHVVEVSNPGGAQAVGGPEHTDVITHMLVGDQPTLYFLTRRDGGIVYRAPISNLTSPERLSPPLATGDSNTYMQVSLDERRLVVLGKRGGQDGWHFIDPSAPGVESWLSTDVTGGATFAGISVPLELHKLAYVSRPAASVNGHLSVVQIVAGAVPRILTNSIANPIAQALSMRPDAQALLFGRSADGSLEDADAFEITFDDPAVETLVKSGISGFAYDGTGDRVITFGHPAYVGVVSRESFGGPDTPLINRSPTTFLTGVVGIDPATISAAMTVDFPGGLTIANAAAPGQVLQLSSAEIATDGSLVPRPMAVPAP